MDKRSSGIRFNTVFVMEQRQPSGGYVEASRHPTAQQALDARKRSTDRVRAKRVLAR